jgi:outer membrane protein OmpA-like peptidoglycan-associated protein
MSRRSFIGLLSPLVAVLFTTSCANQVAVDAMQVTSSRERIKDLVILYKASTRTNFEVCMDCVTDSAQIPTPKSLAMVAVPIKQVAIERMVVETMPTPVTRNSTILFAHGSAALMTAARTTLIALRDQVTPRTTFELTASTDGTGLMANNQRLAERRAETVVAFLGIKNRTKTVTSLSKVKSADPAKRSVVISAIDASDK